MEMESYYDSDEEIAWGPLTLKEIKREFCKKPKRVLHRQTAIGTYSVHVDSQLNASTAASVYFTPDKGIQPGPSVSENEILEQLLSKVVNDDLDSLYATPADTTNKFNFENDTVLRILKSQNPCDLGNIQQTLADKKKTPQKTEPTVKKISEDSDLDGMIFISDSSSEDLSESENSPVYNFIKSQRRSESHQLQNFNIPSPQDNELEEESSSTKNLMFELNRVKEKLVQYQKSDLSSFSPENEKLDRNSRKSKISVTTEESLCEELELPSSDIEDLQLVSSDIEDDMQIASSEFEKQEELYHHVEREVAPQQKNQLEKDHDIEDNQNYTEDIQEKINLLGLEQNQLHLTRATSLTSNSPKELLSLETCDKLLENPTLSLASTASEDSFNKPTLTFNDTIEEIEMALRHGLNYKMPEEGEPSVGPKVALEFSSNLNCQQYESAKSDKKKRFRTPTSKKYDYVQSLVGDYIKKKTPSANCDNFKLPMKPPRSKLIPIRSPLVIKTTPFKNIVSPVGVYIKNSPGVVVKKNVKAKTVPNLNIYPITEVSKSNKENVSSGLPSIVCKPATHVVVSQKKDIVLPTNIKKANTRVFNI